MKKRVALVGIYHESNTFNKRLTVYEDFVNSRLLKGAAIIEQYKNAYHEIGGFIEALDKDAIELVPVFYAEATPGGTIGASAYLQLKQELLQLLEAVLPVDAVLVAPHGAGVCETCPDMDGDWLLAVRQLVGPTTPVVGTLDPHANVSVQMIQQTTALIAYATNPHLDQRQTGIKAAQLLNRILLEGLKVQQELLQLPLSISIEQQNTNTEPCRSLYREVQDIATAEGVIQVSIILGFPYADVYEMGTAVIVVTRQGENATQLFPELSACFMKRLPQFRGEKLNPEELLEQALTAERPVLLLDMGDNVGGGSAGTSMFLMDLLEAAGATKAVICMHDPATVRAVSGLKAGTRSAIAFHRLNPLNREQAYKVTVLDHRDGSFREPAPRHGGQVQYDMGKVALLKTDQGNLIVVTTFRVPPFSSRQLSSLGIVLEELNWIIAKGVNAPVAAYRDICPVMLQVNTPGETCADATRFDFKNRRKPLYPFETITGNETGNLAGI
ncbi:M81 family metallopeptidase [Niabella sp. CC-SYL272]|uniref:M81 family metallopeptidase n=1 Tax=Niabella agricola TaxID=2891571 RepID=UPI001F2EE6E6|nr:M81 family metallopeptidase [Niabella agricola]MCF3107702.1 M81 family metallopeptidase [Niabella agricola]